MDRYWLLTWSTYGTWLPGDGRGFVTDLRDPDHHKYRPNIPRTEYPAGNPGLLRYSRAALRADPVRLLPEQAPVLLGQYRETAAYRHWLLLAAAVMANHTHLVVGVPGDPDPDAVLRDFKAYASRVLNRRWGKPASGTWWTEGGSKRKKGTDAEVAAAVEYVRDQPYALAVWVNPRYGERGA